jgi:hypothetical protein
MARRRFGTIDGIGPSSQASWTNPASDNGDYGYLLDATSRYI